MGIWDTSLVVFCREKKNHTLLLGSMEKKKVFLLTLRFSCLLPPPNLKKRKFNSACLGSGCWALWSLILVSMWPAKNKGILDLWKARPQTALPVCQSAIHCVRMETTMVDTTGSLRTCLLVIF